MNSIAHIKPRRIVKLSPSQFAMYQRGEIEIHSPSGELLSTIGEPLNRVIADIECTRLTDQLSLVESLMLNANGELQLSEHAIAGLADLLGQAKGFIG